LIGAARFESETVDTEAATNIVTQGP